MAKYGSRSTKFQIWPKGNRLRTKTRQRVPRASWDLNMHPRRQSLPANIWKSEIEHRGSRKITQVGAHFFEGLVQPPRVFESPSPCATRLASCRSDPRAASTSRNSGGSASPRMLGREEKRQWNVSRLTKGGVILFQGAKFTGKKTHAVCGVFPSVKGVILSIAMAG